MKRKSVAQRRRRESGIFIRPKGPFPRAAPAFPIVGIGASAGGLEALEEFLRHVPAGNGMAFVIVQHLDPTHKGIMPELLQRATGMKVVQVKDRTRVQANCVYVIPPNKNMSILHGVLHLLEPTAPRGLRLPIDFFLRSLAQDQQEHSVGVILSGMGSDGTLGLRAIKEKAGLALVQDPATAKFDGMPRSAVDARLADIVAPVGELPGKILACLQHAPMVGKAEPASAPKTQSAMEKAIILLRAQTGHDFSLYKPNMLHRRIERRMSIHQIGKIAAYVRYLQENPQELDLLFKELLIGVTSFFRESAGWEHMREKAIPSLLSGRPAGHALRAWVPGLLKRRGGLFPGHGIQGDAGAGQAQGELYPAGFCHRPGPRRHREGPARAFPTEHCRRRFAGAAKPILRQGRARLPGEQGDPRDGDFRPPELLMDPPFTKLDILSCRNLLIYLSPEVQKKLMPLFHYSLNPGGILFLGNAETIGGHTSLFAPVTAKAKLYRRSESVLSPEPVEFPAAFSVSAPLRLEPPQATKPTASLQSLADHLVLQQFSPPSVLVNDKGDILYISGKTGKYLEPAAGKANWNIFAMAREGLRYELASAFQKGLRQKGTTTVHGLRIGTDGGQHLVDLTVQVLEEPAPLRGLVLIVFSEVAAPLEARVPAESRKAQVSHPRHMQLERELQRAREELQTTREEMQTSQEELQSTNEELQSANEELQSTNEELTTSKEEMQSLNEELQTVNTELQAKVDELSTASNDMKNLLNSTEIATVFLDGDLQVRRFTSEAAKIIKLIPGDVGRPITDLATDLRYSELAKDVQEVLRSLVPVQKTVEARDGRWFTVRIMPYRTLDNRIDGVVITFADITVSKTLEANLRSQQASLEKRVQEQSVKRARQ